MKKNVILLILFCAIISSVFFMSKKQKSKQIENYRLYLSNTNFPVVFEDGDWSGELKELIVKDLNKSHVNTSCNKSISGNKIGVMVNEVLYVSTNQLYITNKHTPPYFDSKYDSSFGSLITINGEQTLFIDEHLVDIYINVLDLTNTYSSVFKDLEIFTTDTMSNFQYITPVQMTNYITYIKYPGSGSPENISEIINEQSCARLIENYKELYITNSYSILYILSPKQLKNMMKQEQYGSYIPDDSVMILITRIEKDKKNEISKTEQWLIYQDERWKLLEMF